MKQRFVKEPNAVLDYTVDWSDWLGSDTISASSWSADSGITVVSSGHDDTSATVWLSGGTAGTTYEVVNQITTAGGRVNEATIIILVIDTEGYCAREDVKNFLPGRDFSGEDSIGKTVVTEADLVYFIALVADEINAMLKALDFTVPVTSSDSPYAYSILKHVNAIGAAALAEEAWSTARGDIPERAERLREDYQRWLDMIRNHDINLRDAGGGPILPASMADSGCLDTDESGAERANFFEREMQW